LQKCILFVFFEQEDVPMGVAVIGLGEVGRCFAEPLLSAGHDLSFCEARLSYAASALVSNAQKPVHAELGAWLGAADQVLCCVTGAQAGPVLDAAAPHLRKDVIFADLTTASPATKRASAEKAAKFGIRYVDTAIMGAISLSRVRTPLLAAGDGAGELAALLAPLGGRVKVIQGGVAGDAISLKILRSVFTKGMEALAVELLMSAEKQGVRERLYEQLSDIDESPLCDFLEMLVRTHVVHARRRLHEVTDAAAELEAQGLPSLVLPGVQERFRATSQALAANAPATAEPDVREAISWLITNAPQEGGASSHK
jgi:3-hydroxyisobutyrate dehydrogenase